MRLRHNLLPRTVPDAVATLFLTISIPIVFWFEIFIVLPQYHEIGSFYYNFTFVAGIFLMFNIIGNMLAMMLCDTSIKGKILVAPENEEHRRLWRLCSVCQCVTPPRSWHCNICKICILKRDHHCVFTGYCVGHKNHRHFVMLVIFLFIGTVYSTVYNNMFIWSLHAEQYNNWETALKMIFPVLMVMTSSFGGSSTWANIYLAIYEITMIGAAITLALIVYHGGKLLQGSVVHERDTNAYDLGPRKNLEMVLGKRWYITWISPFVKSDLPHNGIHWETVVQETVKSR